MEFKDIVKYDDVEKLKKSIDNISCWIESMKPEVNFDDFMKHQMGIFSDGHFCQATAWNVIDKMKPVGLNMSIKDFMTSKNLTVATIKDHISNACSTAKNTAASKGFSAPVINGAYNEWDMLVTYAMVVSDHWLSTERDCNKVAVISYEFLSDPDGGTTKIWDYFFK